MRYVLAAVAALALTGAATAQERFTVRNRCSPAFTVTNRCAPAASPSCACGTSCACPAGTCPACPAATAATEPATLRTSSGRLIRQTSTGWVYADEAATPIRSSPFASFAGPTCVGGSCSGGR
jgi:hypothetical protein